MGSDYKPAHRRAIFGGLGAPIGPNTTTYFSTSLPFGLVRRTQIPLNFTGTIRNFYVTIEIPPGVGENVVFTVMINGIATAIIVTIAGAAQLDDSDLVNAVAVILGDELTIEVVTSLNCANIYAGWILDGIGT